MNKKHEYRVGIIYYSRGILISKRRINVFKYLETGKNIELNIQKTIDVVNKYLNDGVFCNFSSKEIKVLA
jgi:hypothetical protein